MGVFEFLLALYSIVAGLGLSLVVRSVGQMIEARQRIRLYWVHCVLIAVVFLAQVVSWFSLWQFAGHSPWTVADTLFLLSIPLILYLVGHLSLAGEAFILGHFELTPPRLLRIALGAVFLPGVLTAKPAVHSVQAALLLALIATG